MAVNPDKLNAFMGKAVGDIGAAMSATWCSLAITRSLQNHGENGSRYTG